MDAITRYTMLLSSNSGTVGTAAGQVSGGVSALPTVAAGFVPNHRRMGVRITNTSGTATLYVGSVPGITAGAGGGWFKPLGPNQGFEIMCSGAVPIYLVATAASTPFTIEELA